MLLPPAAQQNLREAEGWFELGDFTAAFETLDQIVSLHRAHPEVLKLRWRIYDKAGKHGNAYTVAEGLTRLLPDDPEPFVWRSHSARWMQGGNLENAIGLLLVVVDTFPDEPAIPFNLACYHAQLGKPEVARSWLHVAFEVAERNGTEKFWKMQAVDEPDLDALAREVGPV